MRRLKMISCAVCLVMLMTVTGTLISDYLGESPDKVYALSGEHTGSGETEAGTGAAEEPGSETAEDLEGTGSGIRGLIGSVESMRTYYRAASVQSMKSASDQILAGTRGVNRNAVNRNAFYQGVLRAGELGYDAMQKVAENQMPYDEYYTLLEIVEAEATGGDVKSKMLVANVVLNRVKDSHFPDTIAGVVWQNIGGTAQFSPTQDGRIHSLTITNSTIEAVNRVLEGEDLSEGALFFLARKDSAQQNVSWFDENLVPLFEHGGHEYFKFKDSVAENTETEG